MNYGFIRIASCAPNLKVADCEFNASEIIKKIKEADEKNVKVIVFPELSLTSLSCGDLFFQKLLIEEAEKSVEKICLATENLNCLSLIGLPFSYNHKLYNTCAAIYKGRILALIPKSYIPSPSKSLQARYFTPFDFKEKLQYVNFSGFSNIPFSRNILIQDSFDSTFSLAIEISEDLFALESPSSKHIKNGALLIANLSGQNSLIGSKEYLSSVIKAFSEKANCAYILSNAGSGESTQDYIYAGESFIYEKGKLLSQEQIFSSELNIADVDLDLLSQERKKFTMINSSEEASNENYHNIKINLFDNNFSNQLFRNISSKPFVPENEEERTLRCNLVFNMQAQALARRLSHISCKNAVIGLSGGLDSTLALLVTISAFDLCGLDRANITAITMPCFGTSDRTYKNACILAKESGVTLKEINIKDSVRQHFKDIEHDENLHDLTYENSQARMRTLLLMDWANKVNGIVIGTGDLSELALGWCTYNGDHMSMYGVNANIPKTLIGHIVSCYSENQKKLGNKEYSQVLLDILDTPVSPELLPPSQGNISQVTEDLVGPYELHDFFLYYTLRYGFSPAKIYFMAQKADFSYDKASILKWLKVFYRRFFTQQFKRSCLPDGVKVGSVGLSPRGDFSMPSDASFSLWQKELDSLC